MRPCCCVVLLSILSLFGQAQGAGNGVPSTQNQFHGIKIISSKFAVSASPQTVQLDFINDSPANITAWGYCVNADKTKNDDPSQDFCTLVDPVPVVIDRQIQEQITLKRTVGDCPDCHLLRPGEHKILFANFSLPVTDAAIRITLIVFSDGTVQTSGQEGASALQKLAAQRQGNLREEQELVGIGKRVLSDPTNQHPTSTMIGELENRSKADPWMEGTLRVFKTPEWRHANNKEFIPDDERVYLTNFVSEEEQKAAEFAKYQIRGVAQ
jgi:hypothetical protein